MSTLVGFETLLLAAGLLLAAFRSIRILSSSSTVVSGQWLTCLGSSLERHLGNLEEKGVGGLGGTRERQNQDKALFKVQFYYF